MQDEGAATVVDDESYTMELPEWADENQIKMYESFMEFEHSDKKLF